MISFLLYISVKKSRVDLFDMKNPTAAAFEAISYERHDEDNTRGCSNCTRAEPEFSANLRLCYRCFIIVKRNERDLIEHTDVLVLFLLKKYE